MLKRLFEYLFGKPESVEPLNYQVLSTQSWINASYLYALIRVHSGRLSAGVKSYKNDKQELEDYIQYLEERRKEEFFYYKYYKSKIVNS